MSLKTTITSILHTVLAGPTKHIRVNINYSKPNKRLEGKNIVITGGGKGLGASMAKRFVEEGAKVLVCGRNENNLHETAKHINCKYLLLDITKYDTFQNFIYKANEILGGINILVNNAGVSLHEDSFFDVTPETFDIQVNTNLKGSFFLTQEFIKLIISKKENASVLFISSETGDTMDFRPYGFTKSAINSMVQGLAYLFRKEKIRINAIAPGITASDMTGIKIDGNLDAGEYATGRYYLPEEIAETACFLLSDVSSCISGQIITCNNAQTVNARWK